MTCPIGAQILWLQLSRLKFAYKLLVFSPEISFFLFLFMPISELLNLLGLVISLIAAGLMFFFPLYAMPIAKDKETDSYVATITFTSNKTVSKWQVWRAKLGP